VQNLDTPVVVAVAAMLMVQMIAYQVIEMPAMRNLFVAAARAVGVLGEVVAAFVLRRAALGIAAVHFHRRIVEVIAMRDVQVTVVQVSCLLAVTNRGVPAFAAMGVIMLLMLLLAFHVGYLYCLQ